MKARAAGLVLMVAAVASARPPTPLTEAERLADVLLRDAATAAWSPKERVLVHSELYQAVGVGLGYRLSFVALRGDPPPAIAIAAPGQRRGPQAGRSRAQVVERLRAGRFVPLARRLWDGKAPADLTARGLRVTWDHKTTTVALYSARGRKLASRRLREKAPYRPRPTTIYSAAGVSVVGVSVLVDPGPSHEEHHLAFTRVVLLPIPASERR